MASLMSTAGECVHLSSSHRVGRHPDNHLVLRHDSASRHHAVIRWERGRWSVKDLGSRNGSFVDAHRLISGGERSLSRGQQLRFGTGVVFVVQDVGPPEPIAMEVSGPEVFAGRAGVLDIPGAGSPCVQIFRSREGWNLERGGEQVPVQDGDIIDVGPRRYRLWLPESEPGTLSVGVPPEPGMRFEVSRDEEHVSVQLIVDERSVPLGSRVHHYTLLQLARQRVSDAARGVPRPEQGWLAQSDLERMLRLDRNVVYQHFYRARRELAEHIADIDVELIQRRHDAGQLRLGLARIEVAGIGSG